MKIYGPYFKTFSTILDWQSACKRSEPMWQAWVIVELEWGFDN
jgi:hypothetical protein